MLPFTAIHHVAILVSDYAASRAFYVDKLGLPVLRENYRPARGDWKLDLACGDVELELFSAPNSPTRVTNPEARGLRHLAFRVDDVEVAVRELAALGIECEPIRVDEFTGARMTFFRDPDNLPLELHE
ncbi:MAG: VOC family protein [Candidatus Spyradocola sp.]|nr:VOC family protein [Candidatus Spyradocola sp.]